MDHAMHEIDRWSWRYWIDGAGAWETRWDCTSGDIVLLIFMTIGITWMVMEYFWYASMLRKSGPRFMDGSRRIHLERLMRVFLYCGMIHLLNLVFWFWTPHYLWSIAYFINAAVTHSLNRSFETAIQNSLSEETAKFRLDEIATRLDTVIEHEPQEPKTLRQLAEELRSIVG